MVLLPSTARWWPRKTQVIACQNSWELVLSVPCSKLVKKRLGRWGMEICGSCALCFFSGIQHSRVYPAVVLLPEVLKIKRRIRATGKMNAWSCQCLSAETAIYIRVVPPRVHTKKHARIFWRIRLQGVIGWNWIKPSRHYVQCVVPWKKEPFVEMSQRS